MEKINTVTLLINGEEVEFVRKDSVIECDAEEIEENEFDIRALRIFGLLLGDNDVHASHASNIINHLLELSAWFSAVDEDVNFLVERSGMTRETVESIVHHMREVKNSLSLFENILDDVE